ncbi:RelA/SpoT domain-containing protein [Microvirga ossetica]|nr:RelA/SpoT domain-containing protein [Microvirga ossetica]
MRASLGYHIRHRNLNGFTAARLKRMQAIRRKLKRMDDKSTPLGLNQLQDLGGCRAVMNTMDDVDALVCAIREWFPHECRGENDYIRQAKSDGYRCHHLKYAYKGKGATTVYEGRRIELQVRTVLQHSWATAVEAVGLFRGEELKSGKGSDEWLRLFQLMSSEFAVAERCDPAIGMLSSRQRMRELKELNKALGAVKVLDDLSHAVHWATDAITPHNRPAYYLISYDNETRQVTVSPYFKTHYAIAGYESAESLDNISGLDTTNVVLVEADKVDNLTRAYPNYFGDVQLFKMQLNALVHGHPVSEFKIALQQRTIQKPRENPDASWIGRRGLWVEPVRKSINPKKDSGG